MSDPATNDWMPILSRLSATLLRSGDLTGELAKEALSTGWCGQPAATEAEILSAEERLGVKLPPSYRSFLAISNGWRPFNSFIERLLPIQEVERFRTADPEMLGSLLESYREDDISESDYLDYETPKHIEALRTRYYPDSLLIGKSWGAEADMVLLNPQIASPDGEWETIFFANWIPGNQRYRSFRDFVVESMLP